MRVLSKSKLIPLLVENGFIPNDKHVTYEAFGKKVFAFIKTATREERARLEAFLRAKGLAFDPGYFPGSTYVQARVSYFKAWHWDE